jgi:hypothetical protein
MVVDRNTAKPRGYAFIEFEHERDMHGKAFTIYAFMEIGTRVSITHCCYTLGAVFFFQFDKLKNTSILGLVLCNQWL